MHRFTTIAIVATLGVATTAATGCGAKSSSTSGGKAQTTIGFSMPDSSESFWVSLLYGAQQEARRQGVKLVAVSAGGDTNANQQISQIQDLVHRDVKALLVGATDADAISAVVDQAAAQIPVIGTSSAPNSTKLTSSVFTDNPAMGKIEAQCLGRALGGKGQVAMLTGPAGQVWATARAKGFTDTLKSEYPNMKVVATSRLADNTNAALKVTGDWLQRFPDLAGVYSVTDDTGAGAVAAIKAAHRDVKVATSNYSQTAQQLLDQGAFVCTAAQRIVTQGAAAVRQAMAAIGKRPVTKTVYTPVTEVDKANLQDVDLSTVRAPDGFKP
ncbi:D-threitol-binding protein [Baekduia alba]|uniref:sugar ABC transporter substrate-binding protein n=1 Tax=Baekduia alba TaxID=2997333 RepID=UPI0023418AE2|nr:substrate-binding domain-containing protein [Baekduia alba]WCB92283.1 D-threitol-binding protein [Baekduia alba]